MRIVSIVALASTLFASASAYAMPNHSQARALIDVRQQTSQPNCSTSREQIRTMDGRLVWRTFNMCSTGF